MMDVSATPSSSESGALDHWSARKVRPIVILYVLGVFAVFMVVSILVFHSMDAVKALVAAAVGGVAATVPGVLEKIEYQLTEAGINKRTVNTKKPGPFKGVFRWEELSRVVPMKHGFKYYKTLSETSPFRRFWKAQICGEFSGEIHVEKEDLERILGIVKRQWIAISWKAPRVG